ncbi:MULTISPECIES: histone deacetylase [unclassified Synechococcus]|uniref:histone deacetylase family protein n=1 Tax=unclassified Synechococcus TaxID=2626047 RepID=UPI00256FE6D5|nr:MULTISPECIES: histone deacetylase [unclassified Synechococcus]
MAAPGSQPSGGGEGQRQFGLPSAPLTPAADVGIVCSASYRDHITGPWHPECPARVDAVIQGLERAGLLARCRILPPRPATDAELLRCHTPGYLQRVKEDIQAGRDQLSTGDTAISPQSERTARLAAGGVLAAVEAVMEQRVRRAYAVVRPPGHHASAARGMGFCIYNNVAVAARHLQAVHGLEKILVVDWDVHHGNGTQDIFWSDPSVLFFSSHQSPLYPGSGTRQERGEGAGAGTTRNCPLPAGTSGPELVAAWREELLPLAEAFAPDFVLISAGFDSRAGDPLGDFLLQDGDFTALTQLLLTIAGDHAQGRLVSALEGGYDLKGLASASVAHVACLLGDSGPR